MAEPSPQYEQPATTESETVPVISDPQELLQYGVCRARIPTRVDAKKWAKEFSQVTPLNISGEGDGEYAFYRNILEETHFPFDAILEEGSEIGNAILRHFDVVNLRDDIRLDDAFCVHYNMNQDDTSGAKHTDPSDITVNLCLEKADDTGGSHVLFYGRRNLNGARPFTRNAPERFLVSQEPGFATIHWGDHPHETMPLLKGMRTNLVFTYCYTDSSRSGEAKRTCYF